VTRSLSSSSGAAGEGRLELDEPAPGVARLRIVNPDKRGALDQPILDAFARELPRLEARCVLITGEGRTFSAGYDISELGGWGSIVFADEAEQLIAHPFAAALRAIEEYPYPTLAALGGHTIGGGLELALACDLRLAADTIKLGMPPAKLGLVYSHTGVRKFVETVGAPRTRELFLVGGRIDAATAGAWGMVNEVMAFEALEPRALELAREISGNAPLAQLGNKRVIRAVADAGTRLAPELERELLELRRQCFSSEDFREGVRAFAEKRPPRWQGR
jgi:enoyl-CoA hydratase/carnithine racemase